jgi:alanine-synthesizing transaminase
VVLVPNPSYPIHAYGFIIAGGALRHMPVGPNVDLRSELERAVRHSVPTPLALVLNFPSNPTAQVVGLNFYKEVVDFCKEHGIYILSDLAYAEVYFDGEPPPSIFEVPGAKDIAVEFTSLSKTYSMPGWRIGFATGNKKLIAALARIKSYLDYGAFTPIQVAATAALNGPQDCIEEMRRIYRRRRDVLVQSFGRSGWEFPLRVRRCLLGHLFLNPLESLAHLSFPNCFWRSRRLRFRRELGLVNTVKVMSALP